MNRLAAELSTMRYGEVRTFGKATVLRTGGGYTSVHGHRRSPAAVEAARRRQDRCIVGSSAIAANLLMEVIA